ncbi:protein kinase [Streptosporangium sp. NPDC051022]|uniref:serine/threonine-protein kinase n=1 Tax=Streptosporangium sp. NPDC051022 TaxID=3155752 RepID=UPI003440B96A
MTDRLLGTLPTGSEGGTIGTTGSQEQSRLVGRRYRLISPVGRGGMGMVWHAHDVLLDRDVAVKELILPPGLDDEGTRAAHRRMMREARSAARLSHPGIITVHDVVEEDGRPWIVMELVRAWSLEQAVRRNGPLPVVEAAEIGVRMLDALCHAHAAGVLHRDVKPGNVLLTSDRVVLTDFGIAAIEGDVSITQTGLLLGSPAYIPPERLAGQPITYAADLWSFGATLYAAVEGRPPYEGPDTVAVLGAILTQEPNRPQRAGALIAVIEGLLRRNPADRMSAAQVSDLLDRVLRSHGSASSSRAGAARVLPPATVPGDLVPADLLAPPDPLGPTPSRIIETPSGPVRVPYDAPGSSGPQRTDPAARRRSGVDTAPAADGSPGARGGHRRGYEALRSPAAELGRQSPEWPGEPSGPPGVTATAGVVGASWNEPPASLGAPGAPGFAGAVPDDGAPRAGHDAARGSGPSSGAPARTGRAGSRRSSRRRAGGDGRWTRDGRPTPLLLLVCVAALLAVVAAVLLALWPSGAPGVSAASSPAGSTPTGPASPMPSPSRGEVPDGYRTLSGGHVSGALPKGWTVRTGDGTAVTFSGPKNSGQSILVTETPVADPVTALGQAGRDGLDEYTEIGVTPVRFGPWRAADWEYTYVQPTGVPMHGLTRYVAVDGRSAYLIAFRAQDLEWEKSAELLQTFFNTFLPVE